jgi:hypothetical protein
MRCYRHHARKYASPRQIKDDVGGRLEAIPEHQAIIASIDRLWREGQSLRKIQLAIEEPVIDAIACICKNAEINLRLSNEIAGSIGPLSLRDMRLAPVNLLG